MHLAVWLIERPRWFKRAVLIINDLALLSLAVWVAYTLRLSRLYVPQGLDKWLVMAAAPLIGVFVFYIRGLYKLVTRFIGPEGTIRIYVAVLIAAVLWAVAVLMSGVKDHPRSAIVIYALIAALLIRLSRQWAGALLLSAAPQHKPASFDKRKNVIIYGAGTIGIQLLRALNEAGGYKTVAFIDSNPSLAGQLVHGVKVLRPEKIGKVIADENVKEVLLATPTALRGERRIALKVLEAFPVVVKTLPALEEIASGHVQVSDLRPIDVEDLLGRDPVTPDIELLAANVRGKVCDDHRGRRLDRIGAHAPAAQTRPQDARAARAVGSRALRYLDGHRRPQAASPRGRGGRDVNFRNRRRRRARIGARPQACGPHHSTARRRGDLSRCRL